MVDSLGEPKGFVPKPPVPVDEYLKQKVEKGMVVPKKPSILLRAAAGLGFASLLASLGIAGTGNAETLVQDPGKAMVSTVDDLKSTAVGVVKSEFKAPVPGSEATETVRKLLAAQGIKFGDPMPESIAIDPKTGEQGLVEASARLVNIETSGAPGVGVVGNQELRVHKREPSMEGELVSQEDIKAMGIDINNVKVILVHGGPITDEATEGKWGQIADKEGNPVDLFVKAEFAKFDGKKELRIESPGKTVMLPYAPIAPTLPPAAPVK
ncbi:MAG: hypothetical protein ACHQT7_00710 [Candidatus Levyibacteriota bacterium]